MAFFLTIIMNVVITGCSRGIGLELVKLFSETANVYCLTRNTGPIEKLKSNSNNSERIKCMEFDLCEYNEEVVNHLLSLSDGIDVLINNAGYLVNASFTEISKEDLTQVYEVNVLGPFRLMQALMPSLLKSDAHIVNISSMGGVQGSVKFPGLSAYSSSKGALSILTECLAEEYKESSLKVNCLALGAVQTEMLEAAFPGYKAPVSPKEMATYIYDFSVKGADYINGKVIPVSLSTP